MSSSRIAELTGTTRHTVNNLLRHGPLATTDVVSQAVELLAARALQDCGASAAEARRVAAFWMTKLDELPTAWAFPAAGPFITGLTPGGVPVEKSDSLQTILAALADEGDDNWSETPAPEQAPVGVVIINIKEIERSVHQRLDEKEQ
ncbi:hypothetical protein P1J78_04160 [Psychromarinibacter sp. C21-152]|uniref:Uncharacterized protein n=1 Tax=Psychromarinibacter sediminicola TaxID=3033385 RepID=A0AAE3T8B7_9RHOB|nr:hypothetical protein [Psychromarinibacter sediminicola]MDF0599919.1 hypothetical protein [Psychromarinibacter sediminicola]